MGRKNTHMPSLHARPCFIFAHRMAPYMEKMMKQCSQEIADVVIAGVPFLLESKRELFCLSRMGKEPGVVFPNEQQTRERLEEEHEQGIRERRHQRHKAAFIRRGKQRRPLPLHPW
jgi:hypothetical protein